MARLLSARRAEFLKGDCWCAIVEAAGHQSVIERHARDLSSLSQAAGASEFISLDESQRAELFEALCEFRSVTITAASSAAIFRIATLPSLMPTLLENIPRLVGSHGCQCAFLIRALSVVYVALLPAAEGESLAGLVNCSRALMDLCLSSRTAAMIECCPPELKAALNVWPPAGTEKEIAQRLKRVFDPHGILAPGRFRGGI
jgi:FAD/FMN-containing dehydrogenase